MSRAEGDPRKRSSESGFALLLVFLMAAIVAIFRFKSGTIQTLMACSAAGGVLYLAGLVAR